MRKKNISFLCTSAVCLLMTMSIIGCDKTLFPNPPLKSGEMQSTISGFGSFFADNALTIDGSSYRIKASFRGENNQDSLVFDFIITKQTTVPYTIDFAKDANTSLNYCVANSNGSCNNYRMSQNSGSGTLTITSISPNVEGTFSGTFKSLTGSETVTITNGAFNAPF